VRLTVFHIWLVVTAVLLTGASYLQSQMLNHRIPQKPLLHPFWWRRGFTILTDPAAFTETGQTYRRWTIRAELAAILWMLAIVLILPIAKN
jgi:hypothetical protein